RFTICGWGGHRRIRIQRWEIAEGVPPRVTAEQQVVADAAAVSPDLETFVTARRRPNDAFELFPRSGQRFPTSGFPEAIPELSAGCFIQFWDLATGKEKTPPIHVRGTNVVGSLAFSRCGRFLFADRTQLGFEWIVLDPSANLAEVGVSAGRPEVSPRGA